MMPHPESMYLSLALAGVTSPNAKSAIQMRARYSTQKQTVEKR